MPTFFKRRKRRGPVLSKNEQKTLRQKEEVQKAYAAGSLRQRFPWVERLSVQLEFLTPQRDLMDRQVLVFGPSDLCRFAIPCPGRCGGKGSFDLETKIKDTLTARQALSQSSGICQGPLYGGASDACGFLLQCRLEATYTEEQSQPS